ncbi:3-hydroxyacyl-CoA dehydrogenase family protein [Paenibacillus rhizoplanae]
MSPRSSLKGGYDTVVVDVSEEQMRRTREKIRESLRFQKMMTGVAPLERAETVLDRIHFTQEIEALAACSFVVENVTESWEIKQAVYEQLNKVCAKDCILGVNTSAISITRVAALVERPERVVGIHFMNPVPLKPMVEVIKGYHTTPETLHITQEMLGTLGKQSVVVEDSVGFVTNRAMMIFLSMKPSSWYRSRWLHRRTLIFYSNSVSGTRWVPCRQPTLLVWIPFSSH